MTPTDNYNAIRLAEKRTYDDILDVHGLPPIFHYWSTTHLEPLLRQFGYSDPNDFIAQSLRKHLAQEGDACRFVSLGSGNCDTEVAIAARLRPYGESNFVVDCVDMNRAMLDRGRDAAQKEGLGAQLSFVESDLNSWTPTHDYDAVIANQSLHHVVELEHLFAQVKRAMKPKGSFIISDIIGRNGHQRWPEALEIVHEFWRRLPPSYRINWQLRSYEDLFEDWDSSVEGFEGIRSEDILPLLTQQFRFRFFFAFGNIIDPFIDRSFGPNFDTAVDWDRAFIDEVHYRDEAELIAGRLTPTHLIAVAVNDADAPTLCRETLSPQFCLRTPDHSAPKVVTCSPQRSEVPLPRSPEQELTLLCQRLATFRNHAKERTIRLSELDKEVEARTAWAQRLDKESNEYIERILELENVWAQRLDKERNQYIERILELEKSPVERIARRLKLLLRKVPSQWPLTLW